MALAAALFLGRTVAYDPRTHDPVAGVLPTMRSIRADARKLRRRGFRTVTTYGSSPALRRVCRLFKRAGFARVLVGVWDPRDEDELAMAVRQRRCADGYVVGNEGLWFGRYGRADLDAAMARVRRETGRPVATREPLGLYLDDPGFLGVGEWVFPNVHPWFAGLADAPAACAWTVERWRELRGLVATERLVVIAETGLPTAGAPGADEARQAAFFECLEAAGLPFVFFEAFDRPWKTALPVEPHWGLFTREGRPKKWARGRVALRSGFER